MPEKPSNHTGSGINPVSILSLQEGQTKAAYIHGLYNAPPAASITDSRRRLPMIQLSVNPPRLFQVSDYKKTPNKEGYGTIIFPDGAQYTGDFRKGRFNGKGRLVLPNGDSYDG